MADDASSHVFMADERRSAILSLLERDSSVQVSALSELLGVSRVTIRSDLDALERAGKLRRTHGGAVSLSRRVTVSVQEERINVNAEAKQAIGAVAAQLVDDGMSVFMDSGTTALALVRHLAGKTGLTIITTDLTIADYVDRSLPFSDVIILGGALRKAHRYTTGPIALKALENLHPDMSFVCPTGYAPGYGLMTNYAEMGEMKRLALHCSSRACVLFDAGKIGTSCLFRFGSIDEADIVIMDRDNDGVMARELGDRADKLILAG